MKALVYHGPQQLALEDIATVQPGTGDVLLRVVAAGICGSELEGYLGKSSLRKPPLVMGHEFSGEVVAVGDGVQLDARIVPGRHVVVNPLIPCRQCTFCRQGRPHLCPQRVLIGAGRPGAFAEYVTVPAQQLIGIPDTVDPVFAALAEPLATALHGAGLANIQQDDGVVIWGAGTIGLMSVFAAHLAGANPIIVLDTNGERLTAAQHLGATRTFSPLDPNALTEARQILGDRPVVAIDAVGRTATRQAALQLASPGGRVVFLGLADVDTSLNIQAAIRSEVALFGSYAYTPSELERAVQLTAQLAQRDQAWVDRRSLADGADSFRELVERPGSTAKILLMP